MKTVIVWKTVDPQKRRGPIKWAPRQSSLDRRVLPGEDIADQAWLEAHK